MLKIKQGTRMLPFLAQEIVKISQIHIECFRVNTSIIVQE